MTHLNELGEMATGLDAGVIERAFAASKTARARDRLGQAGLILLACAIATRDPHDPMLQRSRCMYCDAGPGPHTTTCLYRYALAVIRGAGVDFQTFQNSANSTLRGT